MGRADYSGLAYWQNRIRDIELDWPTIDARCVAHRIKEVERA